MYGELMSRIGNKSIKIAAGVKVDQKGQKIKVSGPLGNLEMDCHPKIKVTIDNSAGNILVKNEHTEDRLANQLHGTMRALIANMVAGVSKGFEKKMEIYGTGFSIKEQGGKLVLNVGFCHSVELPIPKGVKVNIDVAATKGNEVPARFNITGVDKCLLGQFAADIHRVKPPEPYKGKGIRYSDEQVRRKAGKAFASGTA